MLLLLFAMGSAILAVDNKEIFEFSHVQPAVKYATVLKGVKIRHKNVFSCLSVFFLVHVHTFIFILLPPPLRYSKPNSNPTLKPKSNLRVALKVLHFQKCFMFQN